VRIFRELWNALTYRSGGELPPPPRPIPSPVERPAEQVMEGELLMIEVDRAANRIRIAAVRKERGNQ
jgi:hypothetical protein